MTTGNNFNPNRVGTAVTVRQMLVSGSPFDESTDELALAALETWAQANPSQLLHGSVISTAFVNGSLFEYEGIEGQYSPGQWSNVTPQNLSPALMSALMSIVNLRDGAVPVGQGGELVESIISQMNNQADISGSIQVALGSVDFEESQRLSGSGHTLVFTDLLDGRQSHAVRQSFEDGNTAVITVRETLPAVTVSDKTADLVNPTWNNIQPATVDQTVKSVIVDFTNSVTNLRLQLTLNGKLFFDRNLGDYSSGEQTINVVPPVDVDMGDLVEFSLTSPDGDVTVKTIIACVIMILFQFYMSIDSANSEGSYTIMYVSYDYINVVIHCYIVLTFISWRSVERTMVNVIDMVRLVMRGNGAIMGFRDFN